MCSQTVLQTCLPKKMLPRQEANSQETNHAETQPQKSCLLSLLRSQPRTDASTKILSTPAEEKTLLQENISNGMLLYIKRVLKDLNYKNIIYSY